MFMGEIIGTPAHPEPESIEMTDVSELIVRRVSDGRCPTEKRNNSRLSYLIRGVEEEVRRLRPSARDPKR